MPHRLTTGLMSTHELHANSAEDLMSNHPRLQAFESLDEFQFHVHQRFLFGVHTAYQQAVLDALRSQLTTQQEIADALALKDRSSISKMINSGTIDGIRLTAALHEYGDVITLPTRENAALHGFARATSWIRSVAEELPELEGMMTADEFSYLVGVLTSDSFNLALRDQDANVARAEAEKIIQEWALKDPPRQSRPERHLLMLQELRIDWADFAVITLWAIPQCIPEENGRAN